MTASNPSQSNRLIVIALFLLAVFSPRLFQLGSILTVDEPLWQNRGASFMQAFSTGQFDKTLVAGQPGVTTAWLIGLSNRWHSLAADQAAVAVATSILILIITYFLTRLWGSRWGLTAGFFLALDPFLIAHSRLAHTDALLALFYLASLVALLAALEPLHHKEPLNKHYLAASAILAAGSLLTKMFAIILIPTALVILTVTFLQLRFSWRSGINMILLWIAIIILATYILWPALWLGADSVYNYVSERLTLHAQGTRSLETTSRWWYYARDGLFRLTPITTILVPFGLIGLGLRRYKKMGRTVFWLLLAGIVYAIILSFSSDKSDRYILLTLLTFILTGVFGLRIIIHWLANSLYVSRMVGYLITLILIMWLAADDVRLHPYYLAQYNKLYPIESDHKLGWGEGLESAAAWISEQAPQAKVHSYYNRVFAYFYAGPSDSLSYTDNNSADYIILYRSMFERGPGAAETEMMASYLGPGKPKPEHLIKINGLPYVWIFKVNKL